MLLTLRIRTRQSFCPGNQPEPSAGTAANCIASRRVKRKAPARPRGPVSLSPPPSPSPSLRYFNPFPPWPCHQPLASSRLQYVAATAATTNAPARAAMPSPQKTVVVGAGPVGSLAALYAAQRGHEVEVYELRPGTCPRPPRSRPVPPRHCIAAEPQSARHWPARRASEYRCSLHAASSIARCRVTGPT